MSGVSSSGSITHSWTSKFIASSERESLRLTRM